MCRSRFPPGPRQVKLYHYLEPACFINPPWQEEEGPTLSGPR
jgi:hypothetical protein